MEDVTNGTRSYLAMRNAVFLFFSDLLPLNFSEAVENQRQIGSSTRPRERRFA